MLEQNQDQLSNKLPWWTWFAPLFLIELGNQLSLVFVYSDSYSAFYLPTSVAIILIQWWGPARVLPAMLIESTYNSWFYGISNLWLWPVFGIVETVAVFLSWYLFARLAKGKAWLPDTRYAVRFIFLGIIWPLVFEVACWEVVYILDGKNMLADYWSQFSRDILSELIVNFSFTLPVLYFLTPRMNSWKLLHQINVEIRAVRMPFLKTHYLEIAFVFSLLLFLTFVLSFGKFWFVYGIFSLYLAIRFGFGMALIGNAFIFFITYLLPALAQNLWYKENFIINEEITNTYLGSLLLYLFTTITGRTISDLRSIEERLHHQNDELQQTNKELDHFVYSVSHDLSAPLKSILGLVSISRLSDKLEDQRVYLSKIETSVFKLDAFIKEVLDYSRNKRSEVVIEKFNVQKLCTEVFDNLKHMDEFRKIQVDVTALEGMQVNSDKTRMKIILNNLLSNAIKYQKKQADHQPRIKIYPEMSAEGLRINIEDNGEGINPAVMNKIFDMFFRGHQNSSGSGLGLYIAREAAEKINGTITVKSNYGKGSVFSLVLKNLSV